MFDRESRFVDCFARRQANIMTRQKMIAAQLSKAEMNKAQNARLFGSLLTYKSEANRAIMQPHRDRSSASLDFRVDGTETLFAHSLSSG